MDDTPALPGSLGEVAALVQHGIVRRLWIFLMDDVGVLQPQLQQIDGTPVTPDAYAVLALRRILALVAEPGTSIVVVLERSGSAAPTPDDWAWRDAAVRAAREQALPLDGVLLAHRDGVGPLEPEAPRTLAA
ncbi:hypothetical protein [Agrococcus carbonis]|uniref:RadC-like JAB domain-containing protein n=1 Tax=Agrococcus carbonis TaxID=684552 RepID=A0A1H1KZR9_9MICO|nr:hypothetical protein [Agrococcus carbonis]SDR67512.1 hypothetical protein SAMN04489719_0296 [Agrococcus carbonis]